MSIIHDALKKAQEERQQGAALPPLPHEGKGFITLQKALEAEQQSAIERRISMRAFYAALTGLKAQKFARSVGTGIVFSAFIAFCVIGHYMTLQYLTAHLPSLHASRAPSVVQKTYIIKAPVSPSPVSEAVVLEKSVPQPITVPLPAPVEDTVIVPFASAFPRKADFFSCMGIIYDQKNPVAIINGSLVEVGDVIDEATIVAIYSEEVIVRYKERTVSLPIS